MSQENVELVRSLYEAFNRRDFDAILSHAHPDFEIRLMPALWPFFGEYFRGHDEARRWWSELFAAWGDDIRVEPRALHDAGDAVVGDVKMLGTHQGMQVPQLYADLWMFRDGRLARAEAFATTAEALEAAGLSE
jgi:ketosteroid isomerase-like protein